MEDPTNRTLFGIIPAGLVVAGTSAAIAQVPSSIPPADAARCPSQWGAGDQRGAGNPMNAQSLLTAARLITEP
jgi:hypothetical protein